MTILFLVIPIYAYEDWIAGNPVTSESLDYAQFVGGNPYMVYYPEETSEPPTPPVSDCDYSGTGTYSPLCTCLITSQIDVGGNWVNVRGAGNFTINGSIINIGGNITLPNECKINYLKGGYITILE